MGNENEKELVKKILFGNQKQANAVNDAVVAIVLDYLHLDGYEVTNLDDCKYAIEELLRDTIKHGLNKQNDAYVKLVAGMHSYDVVKSGVPYIITVEQPNLDSPKFIFRVHELGEKVEEDEERIEKAAVAMNKPAVSFEEAVNPDDSISAQVEQLKNAILPMAPQAVKDELQDAYKIALYCARAYFDYESR